MARELKINIRDWLDDQGIGYREKADGNITLDSCPGCGKSQKLGIMTDTGVWSCFVCKAENGEYDSGNFAKFVKNYLDISWKKANEIVYGKYNEVKKISFDEIMDESPEERYREQYKEELKKVEYWKYMEVLNKNSHKSAWDYLNGRGISDEDIEKMNLRTVPFDNYLDAKKYYEENGIKDYAHSLALLAGRISFPVIVNKKLLGLVSRDYTGKLNPKVLNSEGPFRKVGLWNYDNAKDSDSLILCEGNTDAIKCGIDRSVAILGKVLNKGQLSLIKKTKATKIYLALDFDVFKAKNELYRQLSAKYPDIYHVDMPPIYKLNFKISKKTIDFLKKVLNKKEEDFVLKPDELKIDLFDLDNIKILLKREGDPEIKEELQNLLKCDYKDPGDYSKKEMEEIIANAKKMGASISLD